MRKERGLNGGGGEVGEESERASEMSGWISIPSLTVTPLGICFVILQGPRALSFYIYFVGSVSVSVQRGPLSTCMCVASFLLEWEERNMVQGNDCLGSQNGFYLELFQVKQW